MKLAKQFQIVATKFTQEKVCYGTDKPSRQQRLIFVNIFLSVIAYPAFILRFVARSQVVRPMWWDDWCVIGAMVCISLHRPKRHQKF